MHEARAQENLFLYFSFCQLFEIAIFDVITTETNITTTRKIDLKICLRSSADFQRHIYAKIANEN